MAAEENGHVDAPVKQRRMSTRSVDKDAQEMVIESLRAQVQDLFSQVSQLNNKLVKSYDRVSDLEDDLHVAAANVRSSSLKISQLELERTQHLSALNTGLLVEKSHVTAELNRLMEKATEEAAQRGQAESARMAIEKDLDDLSATLFGQANSMVAEARFDKHLSERKVEEAETALKTAEEAVQVMQAQMQAMLAEREEAEKKTREMELLMGKGKWVQRGDAGYVLPPLRLLSTHSPYAEYQAFVAHLRVLHPSTPSPPAMSTLLPLPFLARLLTEDTEPTVRLDLAPSLNWLSRRSVLTAIYSGQLTIEPVSAASLFAEASGHPSSTVAGMNSSHDNVSCALCGLALFPSTSPTPTPMQRPSLTSLSQSSWSAGSFFKKTNSTGSINGVQSSYGASRVSLSDHLSNAQVFIFRLASASTTSIPSLPISSLPIPSLTKSSSQSASPAPSSSLASTSYANGSSHPHSHSVSPNSTQPSTIYPLCMTGWCLNRLRATCTLWAFVRTGILDKVWEEELPPPPPPPPTHHTSASASGHPATITVSQDGSGAKPPVPPRKRGLWGGIASAIGERAASWSGEEAKEKAAKEKAAAAIASNATPPVTTSSSSAGGNLPPAPPQHPPLNQTAAPTPRRMPPPPPSKNSALPPPPVGAAGTPPPLPRRSEGRSRTATATPEPAAAPVESASSTGQAAPPPLPSRANIPHTDDTVAPAPAEEPSTSSNQASEPTRAQSPAQLAPQLPSTPPRRSIDLPPTTSASPALPARSARRASHMRTHSGASINLGAGSVTGTGRPGTPSNVPLPESRPGTPGSPGIPSRATSPAIVVHAAGGAPPPPIPRRAAARTRVLSVVDAEDVKAAGEGAGEGEKAEKAGGEGATEGATPDASAPAPAADVVKESQPAEGEVTAAVSAEEKDTSTETVAPASSEQTTVPDVPVSDDAPLAADPVVNVTQPHSEEPVSSSAPAPTPVPQAEPTVTATDSLLKIPSGDSESDKFVDALTPGDMAADPMDSAQTNEAQTQEKEAKVDSQLEDDTAKTEVPEKSVSEPGHDIRGEQSAATAEASDPKPEAEPPAVHLTDDLAEGAAAPVHVNGDGSQKQVDGDATAVEEAQVSETAVALQPSALDSQNLDQQQKDEQEEKERQEQEERERERLAREKEEKYKVGYVGDTTWEEKAWREIVKLREDMFWARVGGFRD